MYCPHCNTTLLPQAKYCHICGYEICAAKPNLTMKEVYERWLPIHSKRVGRDTIGNYRAAFKWFSSLHNSVFAGIEIDDLQACMDDCPKGKRTKENMKAVAGLLYKYAIPRKQAAINMAIYLVIDAPMPVHHVGIPVRDLQKIWDIVPTNYYAGLVLAQCYLGFRPNEFLSLRIENLDRSEMAFVGGGKTMAGTNRTVTVSPKIQPLVLACIGERTTGQVFCRDDFGHMDLCFYRARFYEVLQQAGIDNPVDANRRHKYTPHSCRHTFATLMKAAPGAEKDKLELMGHTTGEMLRYYQDVNLDDLRRITDTL